MLRQPLAADFCSTILILKSLSQERMQLRLGYGSLGAVGARVISVEPAAPLGRCEFVLSDVPAGAADGPIDDEQVKVRAFLSIFRELKSLVTLASGGVARERANLGLQATSGQMEPKEMQTPFGDVVGGTARSSPGDGELVELARYNRTFNTFKNALTASARAAGHRP